MKSEKFLQFNGKNIFFQSYDGQFWIAIKPICDALGVNYSRQIVTMKSDDFFADVYALQHMRDSKNRLQKMTCLPERYIYGWILSLQSQSEELKSYKRECYDILFNHFHGIITGRAKLLKTQIEVENEFEAAKTKLMESEEFKNLQAIKKKNAEINKQLVKNDFDAKLEITELFDLDNNPVLAN